MSVYTKNDLAQRVLERLGEVGFGQAAEPEARARVVDALDGILQELAADGVYDFAFADEVPPAAFDSITAIVASKVADSFGLPQEETVLLASRAQAAQEKLRRLRWTTFAAVRRPVEFF